MSEEKNPMNMKTLSDGWDGFKKFAVNEHSSPEVVAKLRSVFYSGAQFMAARLRVALKAPSPENTAMIEGLYKELSVFHEEMISEIKAQQEGRRRLQNIMDTPGVKQ